MSKKRNKKKRFKPEVNDEGFGNEPFILSKDSKSLDESNEENEIKDSEKIQDRAPESLYDSKEVDESYEPPDDEEKYFKYCAKIGQEKANKFLKEAKVGDVVYCTWEGEEVRVLELPSEEKTYPVKVLTRHGEQKYDPVILIPIKKGNFCAEHLFMGENAKGEAGAYQLMAKEKGFRTEVVKEGQGYLLRLYGDSQEEVDDFITYKIRNDLTIF